MKSAVIVFPGSNCDRDVAVALEEISGEKPAMVWHDNTDLPDVDLIVLPGGFSYGDYLRAGAMAAQSRVLRAVREKAEAGTPIVGICNGFQVLTETGLLPGALLRNADLRFVCRLVALEVVSGETIATRGYAPGETIRIPVAHHDGNYFADDETLHRLEQEGQIVFRYASDNPNGSARDIAGIRNERGNVIGLMPHPERAIDPLSGSDDGITFFKSLVETAGAA